MQETVANWLGKPRTVVHILCDDPSYIKYYQDKYGSERHQSPPRVTLGLHWAEAPTNMTAAASHMQTPRNERLTSLVHFMEDVMLMAKSDVFYGTTGSTVTGVVQWYRRALEPGDHYQGSIGEWPEHASASKQAYQTAKQLLREVQASTFDPNSFRMLHDQRAELRKLGPVQLRAVHTALVEHIRNKPGKPVSQSLTEEWYQQNPVLRENRQAYKRCWESQRRLGDTRPHMHWFKAMLMHRLNDWLRETRQPFIWGFDNQAVWQMDLAYPSALDDASAHAGAMLNLTTVAAASDQVVLSGSMPTTATTANEDPPAKRARIASQPIMGSKSKAPSRVGPASSSASGLTASDRGLGQQGITPKAMPRSGVAQAKTAPGGH